MLLPRAFWPATFTYLANSSLRDVISKNDCVWGTLPDVVHWPTYIHMNMTEESHCVCLSARLSACLPACHFTLSISPPLISVSFSLTPEDIYILRWALQCLSDNFLWGFNFFGKPGATQFPNSVNSCIFNVLCLPFCWEQINWISCYYSSWSS